MTSSDLTAVATVIAIILAPIVALYVGGILQRRSDAYKRKLDIFSALMAQRHEVFSIDSIKTLNLIDAVFVDDAAVREAWTRYYLALEDQSLNQAPGASIRAEKKRDLLLEMVKALGLSNKISSADLLRARNPTWINEITQMNFVDHLRRKAGMQEELNRIFPSNQGAPVSAAAPAPTAAPDAKQHGAPSTSPRPNGSP